MPDQYREAIGQTRNGNLRYAGVQACDCSYPLIEACTAQAGSERQALGDRAGIPMNPTRCGLLVERTRNFAAGSEDAAARETKGWEILRTRSHARPRANCGTKGLVRCVCYPSISSLTRLWTHANGPDAR